MIENVIVIKIVRHMILVTEIDTDKEIEAIVIMIEIDTTETDKETDIMIDKVIDIVIEIEMVEEIEKGIAHEIRSIVEEIEDLILNKKITKIAIKEEVSFYLMQVINTDALARVHKTAIEIVKEAELLKERKNGTMIKIVVVDLLENPQGTIPEAIDLLNLDTNAKLTCYFVLLLSYFLY